MPAAAACLLVRHGRSVVWVSIVLSVGLRLLIAGNTAGTDDVRYWSEFADGVRRFGPIGIYGHTFEAQYNHPPLAGWLLLAADELRQAGVGFPFLIRVPASLADGATALLVYRLLGAGHRGGSALLAALIVCWCPLAIIVAGFHGNTDPFFVALVLAAFHQSRIHGRLLDAGVLLGLALSVKIVPVVVLPLFLLMAVRRGRRGVAALATGGTAVFAVLWLPVLITRAGPFAHDVLGYTGTGGLVWGWPVLAAALGVTVTGTPLLPLGSYAAVLVAAMAPVLPAPGRADLDDVRLGVVLSSFLLLSPAFGMQYLVWPLAAATLVSLRYAGAYAVSASAFALIVYSRWNHALPWHWQEARSTPLPLSLMPLMALVWLSLLGVLLHGLAQLLGAVRPSTVERRRAPQRARVESAVRSMRSD